MGHPIFFTSPKNDMLGWFNPPPPKFLIYSVILGQYRAILGVFFYQNTLNALLLLSSVQNKLSNALMDHPICFQSPKNDILGWFTPPTKILLYSVILGSEKGHVGFFFKPKRAQCFVIAI
jgi:hypothetical protein